MSIGFKFKFRTIWYRLMHPYISNSLCSFLRLRLAGHKSPIIKFRFGSVSLCHKSSIQITTFLLLDSFRSSNPIVSLMVINQRLLKDFCLTSSCPLSFITFLFYFIQFPPFGHGSFDFGVWDQRRKPESSHQRNLTTDFSGLLRLRLATTDFSGLRQLRLDTIT